MRSSISNSEGAPARRFEVGRGGKTRRSIWAIVLGLVLIALTAELMTVLGVHRVSKVLRRTQQEFSEAQKLSPFSATGKPTVLLLGNSLLLQGVDYPMLRSELASEYDIHRLVFEQTEYIEQFYVLRALLRNGARPHHVVLCTSVNHLVENGTRGEFMSRYMDARDIASLGRRQHFDATTLSGLMFAHWSEWYAFRAETRKAVLGAVLPDVRDLATTLAWQRAPHISADEVRLKAEPRLRELKALCDQYHVYLAILVPPALFQNRAEVVVSLGESIGVRVLVPQQPGEMATDLFQDEFHLTHAGAEIFTAELQSEFLNLPR